MARMERQLWDTPPLLEWRNKGPMGSRGGETRGIKPHIHNDYNSDDEIFEHKCR